MEWLFWGLVAWCVWRVAARGTGWMGGRCYPVQRVERLTTRDARRLERRREEVVPEEPKRVEARRETPLQRSQRRFAEGRITMEQYERELDELFGIEA